MNLDNPSRTWLANLQTGDVAVVARRRGHWGTHYWTCRIVRLTATQVVARVEGQEWRFRRNDGRQVGNMYGPFRLMELDSHLQAQLEKQRIDSEFDKAVGGVDHRCPLDTVEKGVMLDALNEYRKKGASA